MDNPFHILKCRKFKNAILGNRKLYTIWILFLVLILIYALKHKNITCTATGMFLGGGTMTGTKKENNY